MPEKKLNNTELIYLSGILTKAREAFSSLENYEHFIRNTVKPWSHEKHTVFQWPYALHSGRRPRHGLFRFQTMGVSLSGSETQH
jgi:hypothetical protein